MDSRKNSKKAAGNAAASLIQDGMIVGLGSGSTVKYFIQNLANRYRSGLRIQTIPSSLNTELLAKEEGLPLLDSRAFSYVDITVDGADEIDSNKRLIKGGGGALLREKILASSSKEFIVIIDESKLVNQLGKFPLPVEIVPFGIQSTLLQLEKLGFNGTLRKNSNSEWFITDNGNYIYDIHFDELRNHPEKDHLLISSIAGVVDTGFFFQHIKSVIIGFEDGSYEIRS